MPDYRNEFPHFGDLDVELPEGYEDVSWKNDACPCFTYADARVVLYVDFKNPHDRENTNMRRFVAFAMTRDGEADELLVETDDIAEVARVVESRK